MLEHQKRRTKKKAKSFFLVLVLTTLVVGGALLYSAFAPRFHVDSVVVRGLDRLREDEVRNFLDDMLREKKWYLFSRNMVWLGKSDLISSIHAYSPVIKNARVTRSWPDTLLVDISEYTEWGVLCQGIPEECFWIDRAGVAFEKAPDFSGIIVPKIADERPREIKLGETQLSLAMMGLITYFNERARDNPYLQSLQFTIDDEEATLRAETRFGWEIFLLEDVSPERAYRNMQLTLENEIKDRAGELDYIDLRLDKRVFYRFREYDR